MEQTNNNEFYNPKLFTLTISDKKNVRFGRTFFINMLQYYFIISNNSTSKIKHSKGRIAPPGRGRVP